VLHAVRQGRASGSLTGSLPSPPAAAVDILLDPSANDAATVVRLVLEIDTGVDCSVGIYEVPTVIAPGTELIGLPT